MKWTPEAEVALQDLKRYLSSPPVLVAPRPQEPLFFYLAATNQVVSAALVAEREAEEDAAAAASPFDGLPGETPARSGADKEEPAQSSHSVQKKKMVQCPVYFVSSLLQGLGRGTLVCRSCSSASSWPRGSCATTSKHMR